MYDYIYFYRVDQIRPPIEEYYFLKSGRSDTYKAYFTPGGIFRTESRFRDDVATKSLRIVYIERRKPKLELIKCEMARN